jgi:hypothetical protein
MVFAEKGDMYINCSTGEVFFQNNGWEREGKTLIDHLNMEEMNLTLEPILEELIEDAMEEDENLTLEMAIIRVHAALEGKTFIEWFKHHDIDTYLKNIALVKRYIQNIY